MSLSSHFSSVCRLLTFQVPNVNDERSHYIESQSVAIPVIQWRHCESFPRSIVTM